MNAYKDQKIFDFSNQPGDSKYYKNANNSVVGKMKEKNMTCLKHASKE